MNKSRPSVYVCCSILNNALVSKAVEARSQDEAISEFEQSAGIKVLACHGPYDKKKSLKKTEVKTNVVFSKEKINAIYDNWYVKAIFTIEPVNCAYLLFDKRVDGKNAPKPQGTIIVNRDYLKEIT
jgi:hypothetical protein